MSVNQPIQEDEIDLKDLFMRLWAYKWFIAFITAASIFASGFYILNTQKFYTSTSAFKMDLGKESGFCSGTELAGLSALTGISTSANSDAEEILERVTHRVFIEKLNNTVNLFDDPFFNEYKPGIEDPLWKATIKSLIGWENLERDIIEVQWQNILSVFEENIDASLTDAGAISISVTHERPSRSASIANAIMQQIIATHEVEKNTSQDERLDYLTTILANSLQDVETVQNRLKLFTLENNALPLESFSKGSIALDDLRAQNEKVHEFIVAINELHQLAANASTTYQSYKTLAESHPIVNQVEFRRILGISEIISAWQWPKIATIEAVKQTLFDRETQLKSELVDLEERTAQFANDAKVYADLERDKTTAEANYTVLLEQVKAQTLAAGYRPEKARIYQYAVTPISPSSPKRLLVLALGTVLGVMIGAALSLILSMLRGVYFTQSLLLRSIDAPFSAPLKSIRYLKRKDFSDIQHTLENRANTLLVDLGIEISSAGKNTIVITGSKTRINPSNFSRALAVSMQNKSSPIGLIDFSSKSTPLSSEENENSPQYANFDVLEQFENLTHLTPSSVNNPMSFLNSKQAVSDIEQLCEQFDFLILCGNDNHGISLLRRLRHMAPYHISLARIKATKRHKLETLQALLPIESLFYE